MIIIKINFEKMCIEIHCTYNNSKTNLYFDISTFQYFFRYDYTNAYEDIANIIFPQNNPNPNSGVMIYINLSKKIRK